MSTGGIGGRVSIVGTGYSEVGRDTGRTEGSLAVEAALAALDDAGLGADEVDGLAVYPDRVSDPFEGPTIGYLHHALGLGELSWWQAFGTGPAQLAPLLQAVYAIAGGGADVVLVVRAHVRQRNPFYVAGGRAAAENPSGALAFRAPYGAPGGAPRLAMWAQRYLHVYGRTDADLAAVVLQCRDNAQRNPRAAWYGKPLTEAEYYASPHIATPFRIVDCDYPVDGAVAVVLTRADRAADLERPVQIESIGHASGPSIEWELWPDLTSMASAQTAAQLWSSTSITPAEVDVAEIYDGFSWLTLAWLEDLGFCDRGDAGDFVASGATRLDGRLPICTDGGQLGAGRLHGLGKVATAARQLRGQAERWQVSHPEVALACAGGGSMAGAVLMTA